MTNHVKILTRYLNRIVERVNLWIRVIVMTTLTLPFVIYTLTYIKICNLFFGTTGIVVFVAGTNLQLQSVILLGYVALLYETLHDRTYKMINEGEFSDKSKIIAGAGN